MRSIVSLRQVERKASAFLARFDSPPIPVQAVAAELGLHIEHVALSDDVSGVLVVNDDGGVIGVNKDHALVRRRFTIAHEIGHFVLHRKDEQLFIDKGYRVLFRDENSSLGTDVREREANAFAAELLMPRALLMRLARSYQLDLGEEGGPVEELAAQFQVSAQAMTFRLASLFGVDDRTFGSRRHSGSARNT